MFAGSVGEVLVVSLHPAASAVATRRASAALGPRTPLRSPEVIVSVLE